jgi:UDP-N-acetyl-D-glucosamine dehydrogenase
LTNKAERALRWCLKISMVDMESPLSDTAHIDSLIARYRERTAIVAVIGLGYVGLPLVRALVGSRFKVIGLDVDPSKVAALKAGRPYIRHLPAQFFASAVRDGQFVPTTNYSDLTAADAIQTLHLLKEQRMPLLRI